MGSLYGNKWTSTMGDVDSGGLWFGALSDLHPDQLLVGISKCMNSGEAWPPSAPEFKAMCLPDPKDYGLPGVDAAYIECCNNSHQPVKHKWTHNVIYQAGREVGWYEIRTASSKEKMKQTKNAFTGAYQRLCEAVMRGEVMNGPEVIENALEHHQSGESVNTEKCKKAQKKAINEMRKGL